MNLQEIEVQPVRLSDQERYQTLMRQHHYLGDLPKISETVWYVASWRDQWVALLSFSASALKCAARDQWIGWDLRHRYSRLKLIVNNSRFLILPEWHVTNLGSRVLALCERRLSRDWETIFGHGVLLMETFVDARHFRGTVYRAANWVYVGDTRGYRRIRHGYSAMPESPKMVFIKPLVDDAQRLLSGANLPLKIGVPSEYVIRNVLIRVAPAQLDHALQRWNETYGEKDQSLAIDGKTMCNALDEEGCPVHILSVVGHETKICHAQKKSALCP